MKGIDLKAMVRALHNTDTIITPALNEWLIRYGDDPYPPHVVKIIAKLLGTTPRVRVGTFSASSAGHCERQQVLAFLNSPVGAIDPQLQNIFNDGKWRHLRWQAVLLSAGLIEDVEYILRWPRLRAIGTMDGYGTIPQTHPRGSWRGLEFGLELKGVSTFQYQKYKTNGPKEAHLDQVARYFLLSGLPLFVIIYEDKTTQAWVEWVVEPDLDRVDRQRDELQRLNLAIDTKRYPEILSACVRHRGPEWADCPFSGRGGVCLMAGDTFKIKTK